MKQKDSNLHFYSSRQLELTGGKKTELNILAKNFLIEN